MNHIAAEGTVKISAEKDTYQRRYAVDCAILVEGIDRVCWLCKGQECQEVAKKTPNVTLAKNARNINVPSCTKTYDF